MSRRIEDLSPEMRELFYRFHDKMREAGQDFIVTCTYRPQEEQDKLYNQGRTELGAIVTWTRHSKHTERVAFDIAIMKNGKISWDGADYVIAGKIAEEVGLEWGGNWMKNPDRPHFQIKGV